MSWIETVSDRVFPGLYNKKELGANENYLDNEVMSNLPLQMFLYFNVTFAPVWFVFLAIFLHNNYHEFNEIYRFIILLIAAVLIIVEVLRLYFGYEGNLRDKVPELAAFWMLSILIQYPLQLFTLFNPFITWHPIQTVSQSVMVILLTLQLVFGYIALKSTIAQQAAYFRIVKLQTTLPIEDRYKVE